MVWFRIQGPRRRLRVFRALGVRFRVVLFWVSNLGFRVWGRGFRA